MEHRKFNINENKDLHTTENDGIKSPLRTEIFSMQGKLDGTTVKKIATILRKGNIVALPTETVYGLAADATNEQAVRKIFQAKGRPSDNPLIVHVATKAQLFELVSDLQPYVEKLIDTFSPGPITYILPDAGIVAPTVTAGLSTVGIRIPNHPVALAILKEVNRPLAAPSANRSGRPSPTEAKHVEEDLAGKISALVDGGRTSVGIESTVLDCTGPVPIILRPGAVTAQEIRKVVGACKLYKPKEEETPKSPGLKYVHYAPEVPLLLVEKQKIPSVIKEYEAAEKRIGLLYQTDAFETLSITKRAYLGSDEVEGSKRLYRLLRSFSKKEVDVLICEYPKNFSDHALNDRLRRAATEIIK